MEIVVVTFMRVDHGKAEQGAQFVERATEQGKALIVKEINQFLDDISSATREELDDMELTRLEDFDKITEYIAEYANYFDVDVSTHAILD